MPREWRQYDDIVNPFGDKRGVLSENVWIFDLIRDILYFDTVDQNRQLPLDVLRQRPITSGDFTPYQPATPPTIDVARAFPGPYLEPRKVVPEMTMKLVSRMLQDFAFQWRHILRHTYNDITFRRLARAIVRIATMDFQIIEVASERHPYPGGPIVSNFEAPMWKSFDSHVVPLRTVRLVLSQDLESAIRMAKKDFAEQRTDLKDETLKAKEHRRTYLVLSVKHVLLCHIGDNSVMYTEPQCLFDGVNQASDRAIELLLMATHCSNFPRTPIHSLTPELQDQILSHTSLGPVKAAQLGCLLNLGFPFKWRYGGRDIEIETCLRNRTEFSPVEQQICFDDVLSGLVYK